jgi:hypothetical protein
MKGGRNQLLAQQKQTFLLELLRGTAQNSFISSDV